MKRLLATALAAALIISSFAVPAFAYEDSSLGANKIGRVGNSTISVAKGTEFDLEVRTGRYIDDGDVKWSIGDTSVVAFDDDDRYDDEIELRAVGKGTTKVTCKNLVTGGKIVYTVKVKNPSKTISRIGTASRSVKVGDEFELEVRKNGGITDNDLYWTTSNKNIVRVDDDDRYDEEIELRAVGTGTAKITCKNLITGGKIVYTVTVKKATGTISRVGGSTIYVELGDEEDIEVRKSGLNNSQIKWYIVDSSILDFENGDRYGDEIEVYGKEIGTTKVYAKNLVTGGKIYYTVKVVYDYDD